MSELYQSLSHSKWDCKYHVIFVPKYRRKTIGFEEAVVRRYIREQEASDQSGRF